jgi:hypothetical protein
MKSKTYIKYPRKIALFRTQGGPPGNANKK